MRRLRTLLLTVTLADGRVAWRWPRRRSAQQLVDASGENGGGGLAFVLMVVMIVGIAGACSSWTTCAATASATRTTLSSSAPGSE